MFPAAWVRGVLAALLVFAASTWAQTTAPSPPTAKPPPPRLPRVIRVQAPGLDRYPASVVWAGQRSPTAQQRRASWRFGGDRSPTAAQLRRSWPSVDRSPTAQQLRVARRAEARSSGERDGRLDRCRDSSPCVVRRGGAGRRSEDGDSPRNSVRWRSHWDDGPRCWRHGGWHGWPYYHRPYDYRPYYYYPYDRYPCYRYDCFGPYRGSYFIYRNGATGFFWASHWPGYGPHHRGCFHSGLSFGIRLD